MNPLFGSMGRRQIAGGVRPSSGAAMAAVVERSYFSWRSWRATILRPGTGALRRDFAPAWLAVAGVLLAGWLMGGMARGEVMVTVTGTACADGPFSISLADGSVSGNGASCAALTNVPAFEVGLEVGRAYQLTLEGQVCSIHANVAVPGCYQLYVDGVPASGVSAGTTNSEPGEIAATYTVELRHQRLLGLDFDLPKGEDGRYVLTADGVSMAHPSIKSQNGSSSLTPPLTWSIASSDKLDCQIDPANGTIRAGEREGTLLIKVVDSSVPPCQVLEELDLRRCASCDDESCAIGAVSAELGSVAARVSLGRGPRGEHLGALSVYTTNGAASLAGLSALRFPFRRNATEVITNASGLLQQVRVPQGLVVVQPTGLFGYQLLFYRPWQVLPRVNGLYQVAGDPFSSAHFSQPFAGGLLVSSSEGQPWLYRALPNNEWTLTSGLLSVLSTNGQKIEHQKTAWSGANNSLRTVTRTVMDGQGQTNAVSCRAYRSFAWGAPLEEEVSGVGATALTNRYVYSTDGRRRDTTLADGGWAIEFMDARMRVTERYSAFGDQGPTTNKALCRFTEFVYALSAVPGSGDLGRTSTNTPRRVIEYVRGVEVARRYSVFRWLPTTREELSIVCVASNAAWNHAANLVTARVTHEGGELHGLPRRTIFPDGTIETYEYSPNRLVETVSRGQPSFPGSDTVGGGTRVVTEMTAAGALLTRTARDISADAITAWKCSPSMTTTSVRVA